MKARKLLSTAVASTLVAAQMVMPVMADGGSIETDVTVKTGVIRVEVPTTMAFAIDQFEITKTGTQIAAGEFKMKNLSEMDVKISVTSTATLGTGISLVSTAAAVENSTKNEAWLGVAAMTADGSYDDGKTADTTEDYWDLTDTNSNVTSFSGTSAKQTFYLEKGTGNAEYKLAVPGDTSYEVKTYAKFYELTEIATQPSDDDELQAAVDENDVYVVVAANKNNDGETVTQIKKGDSVASGTWVNTNTYYTAAENAKELNGLENDKVYVYGAMGTSGGEAGFTYIGKLSGSKEAWTNTDISKIKIAYDIAGVTGTNYEAVEDDCTYGFYTAPAPTVPTTEATTITPGGAAVEFAIPAGTTVTKVEKTKADGSYNELPSTHYTWEDTAGGKKLTLKESFATTFGTDNKKVKITFSTGNPIELTVQ